MKNVSDLREIYLNKIVEMSNSKSIKLSLSAIDSDIRNSKIRVEMPNNKDSISFYDAQSKLDEPITPTVTNDDNQIKEPNLITNNEDNNSNESSFEDCNEHVLY